MIPVICIGLGQQFTNFFLPLIIKMHEAQRIKLIGICDKSKRALKKIDSQTGLNTKSFQNYKKIIMYGINIESSHKPIVIISTPPKSHHMIGKFALENGYDVYMDKPLGTNYQQAKNLVNIATKKRALLVVGCQRRYEKTFNQLLNNVDQIGQILRIQYSSHSNFEGIKAHNQESNILWGSAYHIVDTINWFIDNYHDHEEHEIKCKASSLSPWKDCNKHIRNLDALFEVNTENYSYPVIISSSMSSPPNTVDESFIITGDKGELRLERQQIPRSMEPGTICWVYYDNNTKKVIKEDLSSKNDKALRHAPLEELFHCRIGLNPNIHRSSGKKALQTQFLFSQILQHSS